MPGARAETLCDVSSEDGGDQAEPDHADDDSSIGPGDDVAGQFRIPKPRCPTCHTIYIGHLVPNHFVLVEPVQPGTAVVPVDTSVTLMSKDNPAGDIRLPDSNFKN
jgi:hypothetical protein